jgi:hypothetical protein
MRIFLMFSEVSGIFTFSKRLTRCVVVRSSTSRRAICSSKHLDLKVERQHGAQAVQGAVYPQRLGEEVVLVDDEIGALEDGDVDAGDVARRRAYGARREYPGTVGALHGLFLAENRDPGAEFRHKPVALGGKLPARASMARISVWSCCFLSWSVGR